VIAKSTTGMVFKIQDVALGILVYVLLFRFLITFIMLKCFKCETLRSFDTISLFDNPGNLMNIVGLTRFEKFEFEDMKQYLIDRTANLSRCRHKLVKYFGIWYFKKISDEEFKSRIDFFVQKKEGITSDKELA